ncbi:hypothetical protein PTKIN_Ptkin17bG0090100 [Pterospermum kingtungense]
MRVSDEDFEDSEGDTEEVHDRSLVKATRFNCNEFFLSDDDSDDEPCLEDQTYLMNEVGLMESALFELTHELQLRIKDEIRNRILALQSDLMNEIEKFFSAHAKVEKYKQEVEREFDVQYQHRIVEGLDDRMNSVQRDDQLESQIDERRIRSAAAHDEAKRREIALQEERIRQEEAKAEAEVKIKAEEANRVALKSERRAPIGLFRVRSFTLKGCSYSFV